MKKAKNVLLATCVSFLLILAGIFIGRQSEKDYVSLPVNVSTVSKDQQCEQDIKTQEKAGKININTATVSELCMLPGIGETLAMRIITYREENGPFTELEQLKNVSGIGDKKFADFQEYITVGG